MKRAIAIVVLLAGVSLAEDGSTKLPFTPYSNAKEGDYAVFQIDTATSFTVRVSAVASGSVTVTKGEKQLTVSTAEPPTVASFFGRWEKCRITAWRCVDDSLELGGLRVACKKLTFTVRAKSEKGASEHAAVSVFFSPDVKGSGIAAVKIRYLEPPTDPQEYHLVEFGTAQGPGWKRAKDGEK
jgi:hypothetical protein